MVYSQISLRMCSHQLIETGACTTPHGFLLPCEVSMGLLARTAVRLQAAVPTLSMMFGGSEEAVPNYFPPVTLLDERLCQR